MCRAAATRRLQLALLVAAPVFAAACSSGLKSAALNTTPAAAPLPAPVTLAAADPAPAPKPADDPALALIAISDKHYKAGERELELGHVEAARQEFDTAVGVLLESQFGGRTEPRIREYFDRLVDRISAYEVKALTQGDGFTEKKYAPASIDELLAMSATGAPAVDPSLKDTVQANLERSGHDISIPLNKRVLSYIELFQGRLHDFLEEGLKRGAPYLPMIQSVFRTEGLPLDLAYVPLVESAFNPNALSRAKAKGVWQFMRGTGVENGLRSDWYIDERSDPEKATLAAAKYLDTLGKLFDGDWHLALASYNGGPGRVQKALKSTHLDDFWKLAEKPNALPRETREYVPMILAAIVIARSPAQYGFDFEPDIAHAYELVTLNRPVDLRRIAEWAETTIDEIQALNPELRRWTTPIGDESYALKVPMGTAEVVNERLAEAGDADLASLKWYSVKKGETLASVARKLGVSRTDLAEANYLNVNAGVSPGRQLMVPREATAILAAQTERAIPVAESRTTTANTVVPAVTGTSDRVKLVYQVKQGDTLLSIARIFKTSVASIQNWNRIAGTTIRTGDKLTVYAPARAN